MGTKSTRDIARYVAMQYIASWLDAASDEALAGVLEILNDEAMERGDDLDETLGHYNFRVVKDWRG